jgi:hypothetical protein
MEEVEFSVPLNGDLTAAEGLIEQVCSELGLLLKMKGALSKYPGCIHWHFCKPKEKGTLEITVFRPGRRIWAKVQATRNAAWIEVILPQVKARVEAGLASITV